MIGVGDEAPEFELPAVEGGEFVDVALADYLGDDIIILAFYPADFNPCCDGETTDLDELDLFTMQKDVSIVGISADSLYSHRAFAEEYDLHIPLLADVYGEVAEKYGVDVEERSAGYRTNRAVVVIDPDGEIQFAWQTTKLRRLPPVDDVREAVESIGGGDTAEARYRVGHAHYVEGRRAFTSAMGEFKELEWMMAQGDFTRAHGEFEEAADQFNTAVRFGEAEQKVTYFERAEEKANALAQAAEWLAEASSAYASGEGAEGEEMRSDAERPLETARDIHEPPDPDDFPPEEDPAEKNRTEQESILPSDDDGPAASLEADIDGVTEETQPEDVDPTTAETVPDQSGTAPATPSGDGADRSTAATADGDESSGDEEADEIDDEELEEIAAELEEQTKQAQAERAAEAADEESDSDVVSDDPETIVDEAIDKSETTPATEARDEGVAPDGPSGGDESPGGGADGAVPDDGKAAGTEPDAGEADDITEEGTLDLADPTEGEDSEDDEESETSEVDDIDTGDHGVPDSL